MDGASGERAATAFDAELALQMTLKRF